MREQVVVLLSDIKKINRLMKKGFIYYSKIDDIHIVLERYDERLRTNRGSGLQAIR